MFVIVIISVFIFNYETINRNFNLFKTRLTSSNTGDELLLTDDVPDELTVQDQPIVVTIEPSPAQRPQTTTTPSSSTQTTPAAPTATQTQTPTTQTPPAQTTQPQTTTPQTPATQTTAPGTQTPAATAPQTQTRERAVYFTQIDRDGQILQSRVTRRIPVSDSPMMDVLNLLFTGPSADELNRGILNLIPANTRILSATVRGNTAYISFSEDFMFNTFGVEGYIAQLRQIVWTVTEFQNVRDVQILIEGRRLDYLGEGIWIGSPINRQSF